MVSWTRFVLRHRYAVLAAWLVLVYPLVLQTIPLGVFGAYLYLLRPTPPSAGNGAGR